MPKKGKKKRYRKRRWFTVAELVEVWDRYCQLNELRS